MLLHRHIFHPTHTIKICCTVTGKAQEVRLWGILQHWVCVTKFRIGSRAPVDITYAIVVMLLNLEMRLLYNKEFYSISTMCYTKLMDSTYNTVYSDVMKASVK